MFKPISLNDRMMNVLDHNCTTQRYINLTCIDEYGESIACMPQAMIFLASNGTIIIIHFL